MISAKTEWNLKLTITIIFDFRVNYYIPKNSDEGVAINLTTYPGLNCLEQDDPVLIRALRDDILYPTSKTGDERRSQTENNLVPDICRYSRSPCPSWKKKFWIPARSFPGQIYLQGTKEWVLHWGWRWRLYAGFQQFVSWGKVQLDRTVSGTRSH